MIYNQDIPFWSETLDKLLFALVQKIYVEEI